jgi:hypothetical protein
MYFLWQVLQGINLSVATGIPLLDTLLRETIPYVQELQELLNSPLSF